MEMMDEWLTVKSMRKHYEFDDGWFYKFALEFPEQVRKEKKARNSPLKLSRMAIEAAVIAGWGMENNGRRVAD